MRITQLRLILALVLLPPMAAQQPLPPPPPPIEKPMKPVPIRVGCLAQVAYPGPAPRWFHNGGDSLSDAQIVALERELQANPQNTCARGYLIAYGEDHVSRRMDHLQWMVENHPEWDGFMLNLSAPHWNAVPAERERMHQRVRAAWLPHTGPNQRDASILHHAAVFFTPDEPDYARALLEQAILLEPGVPFYVEELGALYGHSQRFADANPSFAEYARRTLLASRDWLIVAGALDAMGAFFRGPTGNLAKTLQARLTELHGKLDLKDLPSRSSRYTSSPCAPMPLLRRCQF